MASEKWLNLFDSLQGGALGGGPSTANVPAGVILYDKEKHVFTGFRVLPKDSPELAPSPVRKGRWDKDTGTVVYDDESTEQSAVVGPAVKRNAKPKVLKPTPKPEAPKPENPARIVKPKPVKQPKVPKPRTAGGAAVATFNPETDTRRDEVRRLYDEGVALRVIAPRVKMAQKNAKAILVHFGDWVEPNPPITDEDIPYIRASTESGKALAERYGVAQQTISAIRTGKTYKHIPMDVISQADPEHQALKHQKAPEVIQLYGQKLSIEAVSRRVHLRESKVRDIVAAAGILRTRRDNGQRKLTEAQVLEIRASSEPIRVLAKRYGRAFGTIHAAKHGDSWKHLPVAETAAD